MNIQYTQDDIYKKLLEQNYSPERAQAIASSIKYIPEQSSSIMPDLVEGSTYAGLATGLARKEKEANKALKAITDIKGTGVAKNLLEPGYAKNLAKSTLFGRFGAPMLAANAASMLYPALSGNNYYDQASLSQLGLNMAGQLGGGMLAGKVTDGLVKGLGDTAKTKVFSPTAKRLAAGVIGPKLAARALGGTVGSIAGPFGTILGSVGGGYLLPKLFANNENEQFLEPDKGINGSTLAALAAAGTLATPIGRPVRKLLSDNAVARKLGEKTKPATDVLGNYREAFIDPLSNRIVNSNVGQAYSKALDNSRGSITEAYLDKGIWPPNKDSFRGTGRNLKETVAGIKATAPALEQLGVDLGSMYKKRKQQQ